MLMQCNNCGTVTPVGNPFCGACGAQVMEDIPVQSTHQYQTQRLVHSIDELLSSLGPGEILGDTRQCEILSPVVRAVDRNIYWAEPLNFAICQTCSLAVTSGGFCSGCGTPVSAASSSHCTVIETRLDEATLAALRRIKVAQEHVPHPHIVPLYDVFTAYDRTYVMLPTHAEANLPVPQTWIAVVECGRMLVDAINWLHSIQVTPNTLTLSMLTFARGIQIALFEQPTMFTQDAYAAVALHDLSNLAQLLRDLGPGTPPAVLEQLLHRVELGSLNSKAFASALVEIEPIIRRSGQIVVESAVLTDQGRKRSINEDSVGKIEGVWQHEAGSHHWGCYVISDGMGGHDRGEVASALSVQAVLQTMHSINLLTNLTDQTHTDWTQQIQGAVLAANRAVYEARVKANNDMGATLVAAALIGTTLTLTHLGDSRAYCWSEGILQALTEDHSLMTRLIAVGELTTEEARVHPQRSVLIQSVGEKLSASPTIRHHSFQPGQRILLCSDGLHGMLDDHAISTILGRQLSPLATCVALIDAANAAGGDDNISALVIDCLTLDSVETRSSEPVSALAISIAANTVFQ